MTMISWSIQFVNESNHFRTPVSFDFLSSQPVKVRSLSLYIGSKPTKWSSTYDQTIILNAGYSR